MIGGEQCGFRADIFAFGAILYEMLAGDCPFRRASFVETIRATLDEEPAPLSQLNPEITQRLEQLVRRCLAKDPAKRFQSARDLAFELETLGDI